MLNFLEKIIQNLARKIISKHKPVIIAVTGSYGKTSTKDAIFEAIDDKKSVRKSIKNYNNELGVPLTIIGQEAPGTSILNWLSIFFAGRRELKDENYPKILVMEMAADRPGDLNNLVNIAQPNISVITSVGPTHLEYFLDVDGVAREKSTLVTAIAKDGIVILNGDDKKVKEMSKLALGKVVTYGFSNDVDIRIIEIQRQTNGIGFVFKLQYEGKVIPMEVHHLIAEYQLYGILAAFAVTVVLGQNTLQAIEKLSHFEAPAGRLRVLDGIKKTTIIDDTYNASPTTVMGAITVTRQAYPKNKTWAVLGDMLELGGDSDLMHRDVGEHVFKIGIDYLVTVGARGKEIALGAKDAGMNEDKIFRFEKAEDAGKYLEDEITPNDVLLIKGSQGVRMEKIVKELMANPMEAPLLLVRQGKGWE